MDFPLCWLMDGSLVLSLFALTENLFTFLMHLTLNSFFRLAPCVRVDLQLLLCQTVVPPHGKVPQHFCEPDRPGLVRSLSSEAVLSASVCVEKPGGRPLSSAAWQPVPAGGWRCVGFGAG